jgi:hypothetical protein
VQFLGIIGNKGLAKDDLSPDTLKSSKNDKLYHKIRPSLTTSKEGLKTLNIH